MVFLKFFFKDDFEKKSADDKISQKSRKNDQVAAKLNKDLLYGCISSGSRNRKTPHSPSKLLVPLSLYAWPMVLAVKNNMILITNFTIYIGPIKQK